VFAKTLAEDDTVGDGSAKLRDHDLTGIACGCRNGDEAILKVKRLVPATA